MMAESPPARGIRLPWSELPPRIHVAQERWHGAPIAGHAMQPGGFSPGVAARVHTADGRRVFKAVGPELNPDSPASIAKKAGLWRRFRPRCPCHAYSGPMMGAKVAG